MPRAAVENHGGIQADGVFVECPEAVEIARHDCDMAYTTGFFGTALLHERSSVPDYRIDGDRIEAFMPLRRSLRWNNLFYVPRRFLASTLRRLLRSVPPRRNWHRVPEDKYSAHRCARIPRGGRRAAATGG